MALDERRFVLTGRDIPLTAWPASRAPLPFETSVSGVLAATAVYAKDSHRDDGGLAEAIAPAHGDNAKDAYRQVGKANFELEGITRRSAGIHGSVGRSCASVRADWEWLGAGRCVNLRWQRRRRA